MVGAGNVVDGANGGCCLNVNILKLKVSISLAYISLLSHSIDTHIVSLERKASTYQLLVE